MATRRVGRAGTPPFSAEIRMAGATESMSVLALAEQITSRRLIELVASPDRVVAAAMRALFEMKRIGIADIERAA